MPMFNIHFSIERWKWNADFGIYVSNKGRFRTRDKKDLPIKIGNGGYCLVRCEGTVNKFRLAHRVVMLTWRPTDDAENLTVDHKDHNKRNNALDNLEWVTFEENQKRAKEDLILQENIIEDAELPDVRFKVTRNTGHPDLRNSPIYFFNLNSLDVEDLKKHLKMPADYNYERLKRKLALATNKKSNPAGQIRSATYTFTWMH
jgi:hypothetical protein